MEWYSKCARAAYEQVVASGSPTTSQLTRPNWFLGTTARPDARPEALPNAGTQPCTFTAGSLAKQGDARNYDDSFSIVRIANLCADNLFSAPEEANEFEKVNQSKFRRPKGLVFVEREAANYLKDIDEDRSFVQEWFDRFLIEVGEKSSEYKDRGLSLAADYKYKFEEYLEEKKIELSDKINTELEIARESANQWANKKILEAKLRAQDAKEKGLISAENYAIRVKAFASEKSEELTAKLKDDLNYRQEVAKEWAQELAQEAKEKSLTASHRGYVLAEAFVILVREKSIETVYKGYILAGECRDNVVIFVEEKGAELAEKARKEMRKTAKIVEESVNELMNVVRARVSGILPLKSLDDADKKRSSADKRAIEKAEELQAELRRSADIAQKWAEDLAKEAKRLNDKIKKEDFLAKIENEFNKAVSDMKDSSAQLNEEAKRKALEAEERAKKLYDQFQKEMQTSADQAQKWAAELAAAASKQADITEKRGKELVENIRKELEMSHARRKEFEKKQVAAAEKQLKDAEKRAAQLAEEAKLTAAALVKLAMDVSDEAKKKTLQLKERTKDIAAQLKAAQKQIEICQKELKDLEKSNK